MTDDGKIAAALVAAGASLLIALGNGIVSVFLARAARRHSERLEASKASHQAQLEVFRAGNVAQLEALRSSYGAQLENLRSRIADESAQRSAERAYEFEAKKRLYLECEPLLFQLHLYAEDAVSRIRNLARAGQAGKLGRNGWLSNGYYRLSTYYKLLAPLAIFRLMSRRLGLIDLTLDSRIYSQYRLVRVAYEALCDDFEFAKLLGLTNYNPHDEEAASKRMENSCYWQQGIPEGILANAVDSLICTDAQQRDRVRSFADFENEYSKGLAGTVAPAIDRVGYLFQDFTPKGRPVLWSILLTQAYVYASLLAGAKLKICPFPDPKDQLLAIDELDWRSGAKDHDLTVEASVVATKKYLEKRRARSERKSLAAVPDGLPTPETHASVV